MYYNKKQLEAVKFASKDETRQAIAGLYFEENRVVATDGHRLMVVNSTPSNDTRESFPPSDDFAEPKTGEDFEPFTVPRKTVEKITKNIPSKMGENDCLEVIKIAPSKNPKKIACQTFDFEETTTVETKPVEGRFPDYRQVLPDYSGYQKIGINGAYLAEMAKELSKYDTKGKMVVLHIAPPEIAGEGYDKGRIIITAEDENGTKAEAVIMPMRLK